MVTGLNLLWGGFSSAPRPPVCSPSPRQQEIFERLREAAEYSVDSKDGAEKGGVPRSLQVDWKAKLKEARISYQGEIVAK